MRTITVNVQIQLDQYFDGDDVLGYVKDTLIEANSTLSGLEASPQIFVESIDDSDINVVEYGEDWDQE